MRKMRKWSSIVGARNGDYFGAAGRESFLRGGFVGFLFFPRYEFVIFCGVRVRVPPLSLLIVCRSIDWGRGRGAVSEYEDPHPWH